VGRTPTAYFCHVKLRQSRGVGIDRGRPVSRSSARIDAPRPRIRAHSNSRRASSGLRWGVDGGVGKRSKHGLQPLGDPIARPICPETEAVDRPERVAGLPGLEGHDRELSIVVGLLLQARTARSRPSRKCGDAEISAAENSGELIIRRDREQPRAVGRAIELRGRRQICRVLSRTTRKCHFGAATSTG
jgi:hypothetical protein